METGNKFANGAEFGVPEACAGTGSGDRGSAAGGLERDFNVYSTYSREPWTNRTWRKCATLIRGMDEAPKPRVVVRVAVTQEQVDRARKRAAAAARVRRPPDLNDPQVKTMLDALRSGSTVKRAAAFAGFARGRIYRWRVLAQRAAQARKRSPYRTFWEAVVQAQAVPYVEATKSVRAHLAKDSRLALEFLRRRDRLAWGTPQELGKGEASPQVNVAMLVEAAQKPWLEDRYMKRPPQPPLPALPSTENVLLRPSALASHANGGPPGRARSGDPSSVREVCSDPEPSARSGRVCEGDRDSSVPSTRNSRGLGPPDFPAPAPEPESAPPPISGGSGPATPPMTSPLSMRRIHIYGESDSPPVVPEPGVCPECIGRSSSRGCFRCGD